MNIVSLMHELLSQITIEACSYLNRVLPAIKPNWREELVQPSQRQQYQHGSAADLEHLDLPSLLRVMSDNWRLVNASGRPNYEGLNYIKEMTTVRNRWAHYASVPPDPDLAYRDVDTMLRFSELIGAAPGLLAKLKQTRQGLVRGLGCEDVPAAHRNSVAHPATVKSTPEAPALTTGSRDSGVHRTLNEAMAIILREAGPQGLPVGEIHRRVVARGLFCQKDGATVIRQQVQNRATHCPLFVVDRSVSPMVVGLKDSHPF